MYRKSKKTALTLRREAHSFRGGSVTNCDLSECVIADTDFSNATTTGAIFPVLPDDENPPVNPEDGNDGSDETED